MRNNLKLEVTFGHLFLYILAFGEIFILLLILTLHGKNEARVVQTNKALAYVCNAPKLLDLILSQSIAQTRLDFRLGEYQKLEKEHVLTAHDIDETIKDLNLYVRWEAYLRNNKYCNFNQDSTNN